LARDKFLFQANRGLNGFRKSFPQVGGYSHPSFLIFVVIPQNPVRIGIFDVPFTTRLPD
jgi:hypothetical protein